MKKSYIALIVLAFSTFAAISYSASAPTHVVKASDDCCCGDACTGCSAGCCNR